MQQQKYINAKYVITVVVVKTTYKYRAYPSKEQQAILDHQMYLSKEIYNLLLEKSKEYYKDAKKTLTQYRMNVWLSQIKRERPEFDELHSQVLQTVLLSLNGELYVVLHDDHQNDATGSQRPSVVGGCH